jgi:hypothetical protein
MPTKNKIYFSFFCYFVLLVPYVNILLYTRFTKENVRRLSGLLEGLDHANNRVWPLTPIQQVCIALGFYGGGHLAHIAGLCGGVSQKAAWWAVRRVTRAIKVLKPEFIRMPTDQEYAATALRLLNRFHLPGFPFGIDCTIVKFEDTPRVIPPNTMTQDFWNRKMTYAINVQVVGDDEGHILDIVADWQGANIDA